MIQIDRRIGPWSLRVWGLILNFVGNALALFGLVRFVQEGAHGLLMLGAALTVVCIAVLALPSHIPPETVSETDA